MAKASKVAMNKRRARLVARFAQERTALKEIIKQPSTVPTERAAAIIALQRMPRDACAARLRNRDAIDGRPRGYVRKFGVSRVRIRELAHRGELPGIKKSSW